MNSIPQKQCRVCKQFFPATPEFFSIDKQVKAGIHNECKACQRMQSKIARQNRITIPPPEGALRKCTKCGGEFPATLEYFQSRKGTRDGLHYHCKPCANAAKHYKPHPAYLRQYYIDHAEKLRLRSSAYRKTHHTERKINERNRNARKKGINGK